MTPSRGVSIVLVILLVVSSAGWTASPAASDSHSDLSDPPVSAQTTGTNSSTAPPSGSGNSSNTTNETDRHIGPEFPLTESNHGVVLSQLERRLGERLIASGVAVEARQFDAAVAELEGNTSELLAQYRRVSTDSPETLDDEIAGELNLTVQQQRELIESARRARVTYSEYQLAQARGNTTRARQLGRELLEEAASANRTAAELLDRYQQLDNTTAINATRPISGIETTQDRLNQLRERIRNDETVSGEALFIDTTLAVDTATRNASPATPLRVEGRVTADGDGLADETVELIVGDRRVQTQTDSNGRFTLTFRPKTIEPGERTATLRFVPEPTTPYATTTTTFDVTVESAEPTVSATVNRSRVQFGDSAAVTGDIGVNGSALSGVAVAARLNSTVLERTRTGADGGFRLSAPIDASVPVGEQQITLIVSNSDAAVQQVRLTRRITVAPTPTDIRLTVSQHNQTTLRVAGELRTRNGTALRNRPVTLSVGGADPVIVSTDRAGEFNTTVSIPPGVVDGGIPFVARDIPVRGSFAPPDGNLKSTNATATISYTPPASQSLRNTLLGTLAVAVAVVGAVLWQRREVEFFDGAADTEVPETRELTSSPTSDAGPSPYTLLTTAESSLAASQDGDAIRLGYAALRRLYIDRYDPGPALTHWELHDKLQAELPDHDLDTLSRATTAYERAAYSPEGVRDDGTDVSELLVSIREVVTDRE